MRKLILAGALALVFAPASALAAQTPSAEDLAKASCKEQKAELGAKVFKKTHAAKSMSRAMKACMGVTEDTAAAELKNAAQECKAEREADADAFAETYGANENGKNAYGKCVSTKAREAKAERKKAKRNAARDCRDERSADADAFKAAYRNFGKCVSEKAKAKREEQDDDDADEAEDKTNAAHECAAEREADRKAFEDTYGTNHNKRNAFGKCVSQKTHQDGEGTPDGG